MPPNPSSPGGGHRKARRSKSLGSQLGHAFHVVEHTATAPPPHPALGSHGIGQTVQSAVHSIEGTKPVRRARRHAPAKQRAAYRASKRTYRRKVKRIRSKERYQREARRAQREAVNAPIRMTKSDLMGLLDHSDFGSGAAFAKFKGNHAYVIPGVKHAAGSIPTYSKSGRRYKASGGVFYPVGTNEAGTVQGKLAAPVITALDQTVRPVHAIVAGLEGKNVVHGFLHGKDTFSDYLKKQGVSGGAASVLGFGLDVGLNPATYVTAGTGSIAREAAAKAAYKGALKKGLEESVARKAAKDAYKEGSQRAGLTLGVRAKIPFGPRFAAKTSGRTTAKIARKTRVNRTLRRVRRSKVAQATGTSLAPDFRPDGISEEDWSAYLNAQRDRAGSHRQAMHRAERRVRALHTKIGEEEGRRIVHARESGLTGNLSPKEQEAEKMFGQEMDRIANRERHAGVLGGTRENYVPHIPEPEPKGASRMRGRGKGRQNPHALKRKEGTIAEKNARTTAKYGEDAITLSDNPVHLLAARASKSARVVSEADFLKHIGTTVGRTLPKKGRVSLSHDEVAYGVGPGQFRPLEKEAHGRLTGTVDEAKLQRARQEGLKIVALPRQIADQERMVREAMDDSDWKRWYDRAMGGVKSTLTVANLGTYDLRNLYGDLINAYNAGTSAVDIAKGFKLAGRHLANSRSEARTFAGATKEDAILRQARLDGVIDTGHAGGEMFDRARATSKTGLKGPAARLRIGGKSIGRPRPIERLRGLGNVRENGTRLATYQSALKKGMTRAEARDWVNKHHFDYTELTHSERAIRRLIPFYTFTARNTRLQISKLFHEPGKAAGVSSALEEISKAAGYSSYTDFASHLDETQQRGLPFPVKVGGSVFPIYAALPTTDLNRLPLLHTIGGVLSGKGISGKLLLDDLKTQGDLLGQSVNPIIKAVVELGTNHSFFFGQPIYRTDAHPEAPGLVPAPSLFGIDLGTTKGPDPVTGKTISKWPAVLDYIARITPQGGLVTQLGTPVKGSRGQTSTMRLLSQVSGFRIGDLDPAKAKINTLYDQIGHWQGQQATLKERGKAGIEGHRTAAYDRLGKKILDAEHQIYTTDKAAGRKDPRGTAPPGSTASPLDKLKQKYGEGSDPNLERLKKKYEGTSGLSQGLKDKYAGY